MECEALREYCWEEKIQLTGENAILYPLFPLQILLRGENLINRKKPRSISTFSSTNLTQTGPEPNPNFCGKRPGDKPPVLTFMFIYICHNTSVSAPQEHIENTLKYY
jgi:hypothetical protein